jgi:hypothetical protein
MTPRHGFASNLFGRRTRSLGRGGRGRAAMVLVAVVGAGFGTMIETRKIMFKNQLVVRISVTPGRERAQESDEMRLCSSVNL